MEKPLDFYQASTTLGERIIDKPELPRQGYAMHIEVDTETVGEGSMLKVGRYADFEVFSDEGGRLGGKTNHAPPMALVAMGMGF